MKKLIRKVTIKLQSDSGATLAAALLIFLMCAVVGAIVLTTATVSSGRAGKADTQANRQRYSLESTKDVIVSELQGDDNNRLDLTTRWHFSYAQDAATQEIKVTSGTVNPKVDSESVQFTTGHTSSDAAALQTDLSNCESALNGHMDFKTLRDYMAENIYLHYWNAYLPNLNIEEVHDAESEYVFADWTSFVSGQGDAYSCSNCTKTDDNNAVITIYPENTDAQEKIYPVYATVHMNANYQLIIHLYCCSDPDIKTAQAPSQAVSSLWITLNPDQNGSSISVPKDSRSGSNPYSVTRTLKYVVRWEDPVVSSKKPDNAPDM